MNLKADLIEVISEVVRIEKLDPAAALKLERAFYEGATKMCIDPKNLVFKDETSKRLVESHICRSCKGVIKLPALICLNCNKPTCKDQCFHSKTSLDCIDCGE